MKAPPEIPDQVPARRAPRLLHFEVMTALYGGGVLPGQSDPNLPFRGTSIRGHLRFWWRATRGGAYDNLADLRKRESELWGSTAQASGVKLRVLNWDAGTAKPAAEKRVENGEVKWRLYAPSYVLFPAQEDHAHIGQVYEGGRFDLELRYDPRVEADVGAALWGWINFGGIGARTRRGTGALLCRDYLDSLKRPPDLGHARVRDWPTLKGALLLRGGTPQEWGACWETCVAVLKMFRQQRVGGSRGRSQWPEADVIRALVHRRARNSASLPGPFPRAAFGLPIVFHFKKGLEGDYVLYTQGDQGDGRMASRIILKPLPVSESKAVPILLMLQATDAPSALELKKDGNTISKVSRGERDVLAEFVGEVKQRWHGAVELVL